MRNRIQLDMYDHLPEAMNNYLRHYGWHFNKKMYEFAVSLMYKIDDDGKKQRIKTTERDEFENLLSKYGIELENDVMYDGMYVMAMGTADFYGSSLANEQLLAMFVKDYVDDADQQDGFIFNRFYADCVHNGIPIEWADML